MLAESRRYIPAITTIINDTPLAARTPVAEIEATLTTERAGEDGILRRGPRKTVVRLYEPLDGAEACLLEMGIPVCFTGDRFDVDVQQKVPVSLERDGVPLSYLRQVRAATLNAVAERLSPEDAAQCWVTDALEHRDTHADAVRSVIAARFGDNAVVYDPSDREANGTAASHGATVVHGGTFGAGAWARIREAQALRPAGAVFPTAHPRSGDATPRAVVVTPAMALFKMHIETIAARILQRPVRVAFANDFHQPFAAWWSGSCITFNVGRLGRRWFEGGLTEAQLDLMLHELGHADEADHTSARYHAALTRLGARLALLAAREPALFEVGEASADAVRGSAAEHLA
jgi:hypothetical protein